MRLVCPICKSELPRGAEQLPYRPFCSRRCKQIDLGNWLSEKYRISEPLHEDELEELNARTRGPLH